MSKKEIYEHYKLCCDLGRESRDARAAATFMLAASNALIAYKLAELGFNDTTSPGTTEAIATALGATPNDRGITVD